MKTSSHWHPKMDKSYLLDDLNDWVAKYAKDKIKDSTHMTNEEIGLLTYVFQEIQKAQKTQYCQTCGQKRVNL